MERNLLPCAPLALALALFSATPAQAQLGIAATATNYVIDFDATTANVNNGAIAGTGFEPGAPPTAGRMSSGAWAVTGWSNGDLAFGGTQTTVNTDYTRGTTSPGNGAVTTGGIYSFGGGSITGRALGFQPGGSDWAPGTITLRVQNNTATNITALDVSYIVHVRNDQARSNSFNFSWSTDNAAYTPVGALDLTSTAALDALGFQANNRNTTISGLNVPPAGFIYLRWNSADVGGSGNRDEFALDNITVNATGAPIANTIVQFTGNSSTVSEGVGTTNLTVSISNFSNAQPTTVDVVITGGSAARVNNYITQTVTFPTNDGTAQNLTITVTDDAIYDGGGTVTFTLQNVGGGQGIPAIGTPTSHALTITENEPSPLLINEVDYDMPGTNDSLEFVELLNTGLVALDLAGFKVELVNGASGGAVVYTSVTLPAFSLAPGGYYVIGNDASIPNINLVTGANTNFIQNGSPDAVGLRDPANTLLDAVSYEGNTGAPYTEGTGISTPNSDDATDGIGISRFPNGTDSNNNSADWSRRCLSPGAANNSSIINCLCSSPEATAIAQCVDDDSWEIVVSVTSTGSGSTVDITNDVNGSSALGVGVGDHTIGPFANNIVVNVTVAHQTFDQCDLLLSGFFNNCMPDCNGVIGGFDVPGSPCDDLNAGTENDTWSPTCICEGTPVLPTVGFTLPSSGWLETGGVATLGVVMSIAPAAPVVVDITDLLTGTATSGTDYGVFGQVQLTFLPTDTYPYVQTVNVSITDDSDFEPVETVRLDLAISSGVATTTTTLHVMAILSDDAAPLVINEVDYDNLGTDNAEWLELKNTGATPINLAGFTVQLVNGSGGGAVVYKTITLPSVSLAGGDYYVIGNNATIPNLDLLQTPAVDMIQNGSPDGIGLRDPSNALIDALSYEGNTGAPYTEGVGTGVATSDDNVTASKVIARYLDGNDSNDNSVDWRAWCATPGTSNATVDADSDETADCLDGCPADANKIAPGTCGCGNPEPGASCNDNNPFTSGDTVNGTCQCVGTPVACDNWTLTFTTDALGAQTSWQIVDANSPAVISSSGPLSASITVTTTVCIPPGACFNLQVTDLGGDGVPGGGWVLRDQNSNRVIDNEGNGAAFGGFAAVDEPFCSPTGTSKLIQSDCDRENLTPNGNVFASASPAVSAQWGIGDQTDDGYQFWFFQPQGGYSRKIFRNHATSGGFGPANAIRATKLALASIVTNPLPQGALLNVRVRTRVNGVNSDWGPACRLRIDPTACTLTKLNDTPGDPNLSCNVTGKVVGASGNTGKVFAKVVYQGADPADHYKFQFALPGEGYSRTIVHTSAGLLLGIWSTSPLLCGIYTYDVRVAASFDGGATYCPYGSTCTVEITNNQPAPYCTTPGGMAGGDDRSVAETPDTELRMWPNPNDGHELMLNMRGLPEDLSTASVEVFDLLGERVIGQVVPVGNGLLNTLVPLAGSVHGGVYLVTITAGDVVRTERLVVQ